MKSKPFDVADYLDDDKTIAAYLTEAFENDDPRGFPRALGDVARARGGMTWLAKETGLTREALYRALGENGNPEFASILKVMRALKISTKLAIGEAKPAKAA